MAKRGRKPLATDYKKVAETALKELMDEKKALVRAERALATAKQRHEELIAKVARLDMVERSARAMAEGTEPPTSIRYVYNYPQWIYNPTITVPNYTLPSIQTPWTNPSWWGTPTITCGIQNGQNSNLPITFTNATAGSPTIGAMTCNTNTSALPSAGVFNNSGLSEVWTTAEAPNTASTAGATFTVDLSTYAEVVEPEYVEATALATTG